MIQKLFNFAKKKGEYYLELDEDESLQANLQNKFVEAKEAVEDKFSEVKEVVTDKATAAREVVSDKAETIAESAEKKTDSAKKEAKNSVKTAEKKLAQNRSSTQSDPEKTTSASTSDSQKANADSGASSWEQPFWVKAMFEKSSNNGAEASEEATFATDNLMPVPTNYRRRPGPSLDKYRNMVNNKGS